MAKRLSPENVSSRDDFVGFLAELRAKLPDSQGSVENRTVEGFLEAMQYWVRDMDGYFANRGEQPPSVPSWRLLAQIVSAALVYE